MKISLNNVSKRFQRHWIFRDISYTFTAPGAYALLGPNGSGKSTLLRILAGMQNPSQGNIQFEAGGKMVEANGLYHYMSFSAPGMEIIEEFTLLEFLSFHFSFKKPLPGLDIPRIVELTGLQKAANRPIGDYSSGMKQRVKLAQAIFSDTPLLLLDEPCTNLDTAGVAQYSNWINRYGNGRLIFVASNDEREYYFCSEKLSIEDYK